MTKLTRSRHKTDLNRYLYRDENQPFQNAPVGYGSSEDWEVIEELRSYDQIPEKYRGAVQTKGFRIYWRLITSPAFVTEMPMTAAQTAQLKELADDLHIPGMFKPDLTRAEAERRIALLGLKLLLSDKWAHTRRLSRPNSPVPALSARSGLRGQP